MLEPTWLGHTRGTTATIASHLICQKKKIVVVCVFLLLSFGVLYLIFSILLRRSSVLYRSGLNENVLREFHLHLNVLIFVLWVSVCNSNFFFSSSRSTFSVSLCRLSQAR